MELDFLRNEIVILDGAMGTVLQRRGLPPGGKPELLNFTRPDLLRAIYREYIDAGSQVLCANTFGANAPKLAGTGYTVDQVVSAAVAVARLLLPAFLPFNLLKAGLNGVGTLLLCPPVAKALAKTGLLTDRPKEDNYEKTPGA